MTKKPEKKTSDDLGNHIALGIPFGMLFGVVIGLLMKIMAIRTTRSRFLGIIVI